MTLKKHFNFLENIGMVINKSKTEITLFGKEYICLEVNIGNTNIKTQENIKVLGLTFSHNLSWSNQVKTALKKAAGYLRWLVVIRKYISKEICLKLITAFYFSAVYYGAPVWMISSLKCKEWTLLESSHYRAMRIALRDHTRSLPRTTIDNECQRATPRQWSAYISASTVIKILNTKEPKILVERLNKTIYINKRKPHKANFLDRSLLKIGQQSLNNRISSIFTCVNFDWYDVNLVRDACRVGLKRVFFPYYN